MAVLSYWGEFGSDECRKESKRNNDSQSFTNKKNNNIDELYNGNS